MGRAIATMTVIVVVAVTFVMLDLWLRRPGRSLTPPRKHAPVLENELDGSVYDLTLKVDQLEQRLIKSEQRGRQQATSLAALRKEKEELERQVRDLEDELARVRREIPRAPAAQPASPTPANPAPASPPSTPEPGATGGTDHR